ncbi:zinc ribbon domain-containing protein [Lactobacillus sp. ESL0703]|uniref:zinc ribbon domain-containing protein n=1 Tax=Lactobacillus sp. ESL0703 TaxID=2983218 RepID=UPI0023F824C2|nr:zinc ribbon domain-containing protein [Lactobacillus sp. ESL0703]MDF7669198.1 zinc ribbon domain-containing protein [Lactobacillus sp. ESL0703]
MKKCQSCGALMNVDVNFCTNCGADIRQVAQQQVNRADIQAEINRGQGTADETSRQNSDDQLQKYWHWLVKSWRHPFSEQESVNWYGAITLLIEDVIFALGLYIGMSGISSQYINGQQLPVFTGISFGTALEVLFFVMLLEAAIAGANYLAYLFIYGQRRSFISFFNYAIQASNLNVILIVAAFIFMMLGIGGKIFAVLLCLICFGIFGDAFQVVLLGDTNPVRDKMYGFLISLFANFIVGLIWLAVVYNTVILQFISYFTRL